MGGVVHLLRLLGMYAYVPLRSYFQMHAIKNILTWGLDIDSRLKTDRKRN